MFGSASMPDLASLLSTIQQLYPQARVTSGYRGPDNPLTQRNPKSFHALGSPEDPGAVDVAPIPGVSFDQYVNSIKGAGVPVGQAFDEAKHPFPWTTGPNWHLASGGAQVPQKPRTLADLAPNMPRPDLGSLAPVSASGATLASLGQPAMPQLPEGNVPDHKGLFHGKDWKTLASIALGAIGDGLMMSNGGQPINALMARDRQGQAAEEKQARDRLAAQIEAQRQKAMEPPQFVQNLQAWMQLPDPMKRQYLQYQDVTNPIAISTPQGTQRVPRQMGPAPGTAEDGYVFLGGDPADQNNWRPQ